nr:unnamed protein product [Digitaria exilis]
MNDGADAHRRPPPPRSSRRRNCRRRPPAGSGEDGQEPRFRVAESGLSPRRSGTRSESRASSFPAPVLYPDGSVGIPSSLTGSSSSSAAPLVDGGPADPDLPTLPHGITLFDPDGGVRGPFTPGEVMGHATTHGRRRPGTHSQASSSAPRSNTEEALRLLREYIAAQPKNFWEAVDLAKANERATLAALAAKWRTEGPREVPQQASVAAYPQHSMSEIASRCDASNGETSQTGNEWMKKEVMLCFKKYVERSPDLAELVDYHLGELLHQCFNVESYDKVFHHYNFTVRMKMPNSVDWTMQLYFAEAKEIFMRKYYVAVTPARVKELTI